MAVPVTAGSADVLRVQLSGVGGDVEYDIVLAGVGTQ